MPALWEDHLEVMDATEVNWGASTILAIFFAASLVSAVFFGLGYTFGRGGTTKAGSSLGFRGMSIPVLASTPKQSMPHADAVLSTVPALAATMQPRSDSAKPVAAALMQASTIRGTRTADVSERGSKPPAVMHANTAAIGAGSAHYMVQVGAIGDRKDAKALISLLRKKGFHAGIYPGKHDKFLHVQIGPFATQEQAKTMRYHLNASGYRAILKHGS